MNIQSLCRVLPPELLTGSPVVPPHETQPADAAHQRGCVHRGGGFSGASDPDDVEMQSVIMADIG